MLGQRIKKIDLDDIINFISPAFEEISSDIQTDRIKNFKPNPLYKEYERALKLAQLILKRYSYNITETETEAKTTPPFWIVSTRAASPTPLGTP